MCQGDKNWRENTFKWKNNLGKFRLINSILNRYLTAKIQEWIQCEILNTHTLGQSESKYLEEDD